MVRLSTDRTRRVVWRIRFAAGLAIASTFAAGSVYAVKSGLADVAFRRGDAESIDLARRLAPGDASYQAQEFVLTNNLSYLNRTVSLNTYYSWAWIQLGLAAENTGNAARAEQYLERAANVDRTFTPRWVLCDFSFRHAKEARFWHWAHEALAIRDADPRAVFRLAWREAPDGGAILEKAQIPPGPASKKFLSFLLEEQASAARWPLVQKLLPAAEPDQKPLLISHVEKLIANGNASDAVSLWNALCERSYLPFQPLRPEQQRSLTNADFAAPFSGRGFDWRMEAHPGITRELDAEPRELKLQLSGAQPEQCTVLSQRLPVVARAHEEFQFESRLESAHPQEGMCWKIRDSSGSVIAESAPLTNSSWTRTRVSFITTASPLVTLSLEYQRPLGATRLAGVLSLRALATGP